MSFSSDIVTALSELLSILPESSFVRFLTDNRPLESKSQFPHCFHFGTAGKGIRSPRIPILVDGIVIPVVVDTGAEVSMLSDDAMIKLFPNGYWASNNRKVKSLAGDAIKIKGPIRLSVEVCRLPVMHEFYHLDGMEHSLLGFDLFQAASLVIDSELGCIWSVSYTHLTLPTNREV